MTEQMIFYDYQGDRNLTGTKIGEWTVLGYAGDKLWWCQCSCGTVRKLKSWSLVNGRTLSCGHTKKNNIVGQTFGEWTVLKYLGDRKYLCRCSCGKEKEVSGYSLTSGKSKSCGHNTSAFIDETGNIYGELEVLRYVGEHTWRCRCSCGKEIDVLGKRLRSGVTKSCGHDRKLDLAGKQFGQWTVLKYAGNLKWTCKCSCGTVRDVLGEALRSHRSLSCGCGGKDVAENYRNVMMTKYGDISSARINKPRDKWQIETLNDKDKLSAFILSKTEGSEKPMTSDLCTFLDISPITLNRVIDKYKLWDLVNESCYASSGKEDEVYEYMTSIYKGEIIRHDRKSIFPLELDIYIPDKKLAIEFNGVYWHSELLKDKYYHINKTKKCTEKGIRLIHIFEYEWDSHKDIVKNFLYSVVCNKKPVYARDLDIKYIDSNCSSEFLQKYHLQGNINASIKIGAYYNNELIGVMTFGTPRFNTSAQYELLRLAWKSDIAVIGGSQRLLNRFIVDYKPSSIVSYCNLSKFDGHVYTDLGFLKQGELEPNYVWSNGIDVVSRYKTQKQKLIDKGLGTVDETENDIMHRLGYYKIYDCGNITFIWNSKK